MPEANEKRLVEICEPVFLAVSEIQRLASGGVLINVQAQHNDLSNRFRNCEREATAAGLRQNWEEIEPALRCFADSMVEGTGGALAREWSQHRLANAPPYNIEAGDSAFFVKFLVPDLTEAPREKSDELIQRLEVYYACLQLGFEGSYRGKAAELAQLKNKLASHLRGFFDRSARDKLTPEAYEDVVERHLELDTKPALWGSLALAVVFVVVTAFMTRYLYKKAVSSLADSVGIVEAKLKGTP